MKLILALSGLVLSVGLAPSLRAVEFEPWSYTDNYIFPSAVISTATVDWAAQQEEEAEEESTEETEEDADADAETDTEAEAEETEEETAEEEMPVYGNPSGWLAVLLKDVPAEANVKVEISVDGFLKKATWEGVIEEAAEEVHIFPSEAWDFQALGKVREQHPANATFKVTVNGKALPTQNQVFTVRSINDCPFFVIWDEEENDFDDFTFVFAAYVNENHPWVDGILKDALKTGIVDSFTGYQSEDPEEVLRQVYAVWSVLQKRGISYSDVSTTTPAGRTVCQTVRFLDESIDAQQANCVDGSVLLASVLRKIGLDVYLTMVPGHCLLSFNLVPISDDAEQNVIMGLETTLLGSKQAAETEVELEALANLKNTKFKDTFNTFSAAIAVGTGTVQENQEGFDSAENPNIQQVSITDARQMGIMPIASGKERRKE